MDELTRFLGKKLGYRYKDSDGDGEKEGEDEQSNKEELKEKKRDGSNIEGEMRRDEHSFGERLDHNERKDSVKSKKSYQHERNRFNSVGSKFVPQSERAFQNLTKLSPKINFINQENYSKPTSKKDTANFQKPVSIYFLSYKNNCHSRRNH
jgi:hypothetical protein